MNRADSRLLRHLAIAVAVKLLVLVALWWWFVHDAVVHVGSEQTATHLSAPAPSATHDLPPAPSNKQETSP